MEIIFSKKIFIRNDCNTIYNELKNCLIDSAKSKLWPNNYSVVKLKNGLLNVNYKLGINYKTSYNVIFYNKKIIYSPSMSHPLKGRVEIRLEKIGKNCVIIWKGKYSNANVLHWLFFNFYSFFFFKALKHNLKYFEKI